MHASPLCPIQPAHADAHSRADSFKTLCSFEQRSRTDGCLLRTTDLAGALESEQFRRFLDQVPIAIAVAKMKGREWGYHGVDSGMWAVPLVS